MTNQSRLRYAPQLHLRLAQHSQKGVRSWRSSGVVVPRARGVGRLHGRRLTVLRHSSTVGRGGGVDHVRRNSGPPTSEDHPRAPSTPDGRVMRARRRRSITACVEHLTPEERDGLRLIRLRKAAAVAGWGYHRLLQAVKAGRIRAYLPPGRTNGWRVSWPELLEDCSNRVDGGHHDTPPDAEFTAAPPPPPTGRPAVAYEPGSLAWRFLNGGK